jgi:predicted phosphodiesterase
MKTKKKKFKLLLSAAVLIVFLGILGGCFLFQGDRRYLPNDGNLTVVHLTDLHLSSTSKFTETPWTHKIVMNGYKLHKKCTGKAYELLEEAVRAINEKIKPDLVVVTGDIVDKGNDIEGLKKGKEILNKINCPVIIAKGDHDIARKPENKPAFEEIYGKLDGVSTYKTYPFYFIPYESDEGTFERLQEAIKTFSAKNKTSFLCMHRMLYASWLIDTLSKKYCSEILSPKKEKIITILNNSPGNWIVLCGHSHTNYETTVGNITELCTSSLAEYPHEFRIVKLKDGKIHTRIVKLDEFKND